MLAFFPAFHFISFDSIFLVGFNVSRVIIDDIEALRVFFALARFFFLHRIDTCYFSLAAVAVVATAVRDIDGWMNFERITFQSAIIRKPIIILHSMLNTTKTTTNDCGWRAIVSSVVGVLGLVFFVGREGHST